jgi:hypothetical protein
MINLPELSNIDIGSQAKLDSWNASDSLFDFSAHDFASLPNDLFNAYPDVNLELMPTEFGESASSIPAPPGSDNVLATTSWYGPAYVPIPRAPTTSIRSFQRHTNYQPRSVHMSHLIIQTLRSYPLMLLRGDALPPYIHPNFISQPIDDLEPLTTCLSLIHMLRAAPSTATRRLFWRNVRLECERFLSEYTTMSRLTVLAAIQALSIYCLLRIREGETEENNVDALLLNTVVVR